MAMFKFGARNGQTHFVNLGNVTHCTYTPPTGPKSGLGGALELHFANAKPIEILGDDIRAVAGIEHRAAARPNFPRPSMFTGLRIMRTARSGLRREAMSNPITVALAMAIASAIGWGVQRLIGWMARRGKRPPRG